MAAIRRWDLETVIDMGPAPVPDDAPVRFKGRYAGSIQALARGTCPECLVHLVVVTEPGRPWNVTMEHSEACPYSAESMRMLAGELGLVTGNPGPPSVVVHHEEFQALAQLEIDPYL